MQRKNILIIEDEKSIADILIYNLENEGWEVNWARDGRDGLLEAQSQIPDLIILDLMLPGMDGLAVCRHLRSDPRTQGIRILMLTAKAEETDEIIGFNMGADDYVTKPFKVQPLMHRIRAMLRRSGGKSDSRNVIALHGLEIDRVQHTCVHDGVALDLTPTEFKMLWTMASQPGRPFSRNELMDTSRGEDANALERTIDVHVRSLRRKLGTASELVETVRGVGYRLARK